MPAHGAQLVERQNFGFRCIPSAPTPEDQVLVVGDEVVQAVSIAPQSEIDCAWLVAPGSSSQGGVEGVGNAFTGRGNAPPRAVYKLCVGQPIIGPFKGPLLASPYYGYSFASSLNDPDFLFAKLSLLVWTAPPASAIPGGQARAPLRASWNNKIAGNGGKVLIPLFGRGMVRAFASSRTGVAATIGVSYVWFDANGVETLAASTGMGVPATGLSSLKTSDLPDFLLFTGDAAQATDFMVDALDF